MSNQTLTLAVVVCAFLALFLGAPAGAQSIPYGQRLGEDSSGESYSSQLRRQAEDMRRDLQQRRSTECATRWDGFAYRTSCY